MNSYKQFACIGLVLALSGCGGGGADTSPSPPPVGTVPPPPPPPAETLSCESVSSGTPAAPPAIVALPGGIWYGTLINERVQTSEPFTAIVTEDGRFRFQSSGHTQFAGSLTTSEDAFTGDGLGYSGGNLWHDGSLISDLSVAGSIAERDTLTGTWGLASGDGGCFEFFYDSDLYERPSSLDLLAGVWSEYDDWGWATTVAIDADGAFTGSDPYGCNYAGQFALIDDRYNLYEAQSTITGSDCGWAGSYAGLAYRYDPYKGSQANDQLYVSFVSDTQSLRDYFSK